MDKVNLKVIRRVDGMFQSQTRGLCADLENALVAGDHNLMREKLHELKGIYAMLGFHGLVSRCEEIQAALPSQDPAALAVKIRKTGEEGLSIFNGFLQQEE